MEKKSVSNDTSLALQKNVSTWILRLQQFADRPWYLPFVSFVVAMDLFLLIIPSDGIMVSSVLLRPKRWVSAFLWVSIGSSLGALALAWLIQADAEIITHNLLPYLFESSGWESTKSFIEQHGVWALAFISFSIFPQQPAVAVAALAGMPLGPLFASVCLGRLLKYGLLAYFARHAPSLLKKVWFIRKEVEQLQRAKIQ